MNILIVEDEATSREMLVAILKAEGPHKIMTAADGNEALRLMEDPRHPFDVVFLDLNLPMISGLDLLERVRATPACRFVRVIICTTSTDSATVVRAARLGVRHYMVKPADKIRVFEQLNIIKAEIAGLQKIEEAGGGRGPPRPRHADLQDEGKRHPGDDGEVAHPGEGQHSLGRPRAAGDRLGPPQVRRPGPRPARSRPPLLDPWRPASRSRRRATSPIPARSRSRSS